MLHGPPTCPHCDCEYKYVKHIKERIVAVKDEKGNPIIQNEIEKYCKHCENRWIHTYNEIGLNLWRNCIKECDCGLKTIHSKTCASSEYT